MKNKNLVLPISVVIAGIIIAGTIYYTRNNKPLPNNANPVPAQKQEIKGPRPIGPDDHVLGSPEAALTFILFTDFECPFCKRFNVTTKQMMEEYGKQGKILLVFRHFPLDSLHTKSRKEAEASECASDIGGNDKFWQYVDRLFEITPSNDKLELTELPKIAEYVGIDKEKFNECLNSGKFAARVQKDYEDAVASGAEGTPYFVIINKKGEKYPVSGALPYSEIKLILNQLLETK
ncbi:MAG: DsbA family protein [Candidatus Terrybacteria bacterium]|nr:DsbA family protein [Candidatus Terrybacteria bacterium]